MNSRDMRCWIFGDVVDGEQTETLKILIQAGLTTDLQNPDDSMRYVTEAAKKGYSTIFRLLMEADCSKEPRHITPLIYAALRNDVEALKGLLELGVGIDEANEFGQTALMSAAECGHVRAVELLIGAGANVNVQDKSGNTALFYAVETNPEPRVKYAKKNFDDYFGFIQNRCEVLKKLIAAGADTKLLKNVSIMSLVEHEFERLNHLAMVLMDAGYDYSMEPQCDPTFVKSFVKQLQTTSSRFSKEFHISGLLEWAKTNGHVKIRRLLLKLNEDIRKNGIQPALEMALSDEWYTDKGTDKVTDKGTDKGTDKK